MNRNLRTGPSTLIMLLATFAIAVTPALSAQASPLSDTIGVRQWSPTAGVGGIFHDWKGRPLVDANIPESANEPPVTVMSLGSDGNLNDVELNVAHGLPNNSDVFLKTTGTVYLLEQGSNEAVSDIITLSFEADPNAFTLIFATLTLQSDPGNFSIPSGTSPKAILTETGSPQDITSAIFDTTAPGATHALSNSPGTYPFAVLVTSDVDVPEPSSLILIVGIFGLAAALRYRPAGQ